MIEQNHRSPMPSFPLFSCWSRRGKERKGSRENL